MAGANGDQILRVSLVTVISEIQTKMKKTPSTMQTSYAPPCQPWNSEKFYHDEMIHNTFINDNKIPLGNIVKRPYPLRTESRVKKMTAGHSNPRYWYIWQLELQPNLMEESLVNSHWLVTTRITPSFPSKRNSLRTIMK